MRIHWIQHVPFEGIGSIADWIKRKDHRVSFTKLYEKEIYPEIEEIDWLIIMGGPMGVHDKAEYPWLESEKIFLKEAIQKRKTLIGICLGAQLLADALGGEVYKNRYREIGWFPVGFFKELEGAEVFPDELTVFHWHGDTFRLPEGARLLASSQGCENQAFVWEERVFGFQFHLEITEKGAIELIKNCGEEIVAGDYIQPPLEILSDESRFQSINGLMDTFLDSIEAKI
ncbi:type 1 glutamine amidotransferase [Thermodesulfobacteriota bacterium]